MYSLCGSWRYNRKVKKLFATMDSSGDGAINFEEFSKLVKSPKLRFGSRF